MLETENSWTELRQREREKYRETGKGAERDRDLKAHAMLMDQL